MDLVDDDMLLDAVLDDPLESLFKAEPPMVIAIKSPYSDTTSPGGGTLTSPNQYTSESDMGEPDLKEFQQHLSPSAPMLTQEEQSLEWLDKEFELEQHEQEMLNLESASMHSRQNSDLSLLGSRHNSDLSLPNVDSGSDLFMPSEHEEEADSGFFKAAPSKPKAKAKRGKKKKDKRIDDAIQLPPIKSASIGLDPGLLDPSVNYVVLREANIWELEYTSTTLYKYYRRDKGILQCFPQCDLHKDYRVCKLRGLDHVPMVNGEKT